MEQFSFEFDAAVECFDDAAITPNDSDVSWPQLPDLTPAACPNNPKDKAPRRRLTEEARNESLIKLYGRDGAEKTIAMLRELEVKMLAEGRQLPRWQGANKDIVSLRALAGELGIAQQRFQLPSVGEVIAEMAARLGIEPGIERPYVKGILERVDNLAAELRKSGGKMPRNFRAPLEPSWRKVRELLGMQTRRLPKIVERRVLELYAEFGIEDARPSPLKQKLLDWEERAELEGLRIPAIASNPNEPHVPLCAEMLGFEHSHLYIPRYRDILRALGQKFGFEVVPSPREMRPIPSLVLTEAWAQQEGLKVPQHPNYPGRPWFTFIAEQIGIGTNTIWHRPAIREAIIRAGNASGYVTVIQPVEAEAVLLWELREKAVEMRRDEVRGTKSENAQVNNLIWRLNQLAEMHPDGEVAEARVVLDEAASSKVGDAKFHGEMRVLSRCLEQLELSRRLPTDFSEAVREICKRARLSFKATSREAGLPPETVGRWVSHGCPAPHRLEDVEAVERVLGAEPSTLVSRMACTIRGHRQAPLDRFPEHVRADRLMRLRIKLRLRSQDYLLSDADFDARCRELEAEIRAETKPLVAFTKARRHALSHLPPLVERQFAAVCELASMDGPERRRANARYGAADNDLIWSQPTVERHARTFKSFFGFLSEAVDNRPALPLDQMSLAMALVPSLALDYANWLPTLREAGAGGRIVSVTDVQPFQLFMTLLRPGGVLRQMPDLAKTLLPIPNHLDAGRIRCIQENWVSACEDAYSRHRSLNGSYFNDEFDSTSEIASLMPVLSLPDPREALTHQLLMPRMRRDRALMAEGNPAWALAVRNELYVHLQDQMVLREGTISQIAPHHFYASGGNIELHLPRQFFKNKRSARVWKRGKLWINFERVLEDDLGAHALYELYVECARPILVRAGSGDPGTFFVSDGGLAQSNFNVTTRVLSHEYLIDHPEADEFWRRQRHLRNHDFRHLLATSLLRRTGDARAAAHALMDTVETVESTYAFIRAEDENSRLRELMKVRKPPG